MCVQYVVWQAGGALTWDGCNNFPLVQPVQDGGLSGIVQPEDENPHFLAAEKPSEDLGQENSHGSAPKHHLVSL